jgi:hypothetical protein
MSVAGGDARLHRARIGAHPQHHLVVVRLEHEEVAPRERVAHPRGGSAQIGGDPDPRARRDVHQRDRDRVGRVVGGEEGLDPEAADLEGTRDRVGLRALVAAEEVAAGGEGALGEVDRGSVPAGEHAHPAGVVAVVVRDQDRVELGGSDARHAEPGLEVAGAEPGVHQHASPLLPVVGLHQHGVSRASAAEAAHPHRFGFS